VDHDGMRGASLANATNLPVDTHNTAHMAVTPRRFCRCVGTAGEVNYVAHGCTGRMPVGSWGFGWNMISIP
jgi:hypothetical protein